MWRVKYLFYSIVLGFVLTFPFSAYAAEHLVYDYKPNQQMRSYLQDAPLLIAMTDVQTLKIAAVDLNEDGIREFILRPVDCSGYNSLCPYEILAQTESGSYLSLGSVQARKLLLGHDYTNGIRNLLIFRDRLNDFNYDVYTWDAKQSRYTLKSGG